MWHFFSVWHWGDKSIWYYFWFQWYCIFKQKRKYNICLEIYFANYGRRSVVKNWRGLLKRIKWNIVCMLIIEMFGWNHVNQVENYYFLSWSPYHDHKQLDNGYLTYHEPEVYGKKGILRNWKMDKFWMSYILGVFTSS